MKNIIAVLPKEWQESVEKTVNDNITDVRICYSSPVVFYSPSGEICPEKEGAFLIPDIRQISGIIRTASENSVYSYMDDIREGFITLKGGHRLGLCGKAVYDGESLSNIRNVNGINIRVAREMAGISSEVIPRISSGQKILSTIIVSPPGCGKTTLLRDIARTLGNRKNFRPALIDSRYELAAEHQGKPGLDVGKRTMIMSGYRKSDGFSHAIRNLSPDVILCDEIDKSDIPALNYSATCGVSLVVTAHGSSLQEIRKKMDLSLFGRIVLLSGKTKSAQIFNTEGE